MYENSQELKRGVFDPMGPQAINQIQNSLDESGRDYNSLHIKAHSTQRDISPRYTIDPLPYVISPEEFEFLQQAAAQWGEYLTRVYRDIYSSQTLVQRGELSPQLLWNPEHYYSEFHQLSSDLYPPLSLIRLDVIKRGGNFYLNSIDAGPPSILGRAVEGRIRQSRVFGQRVPRKNLERIAPFFINLKEIWRTFSPRKIDEPNVMLWSPGAAHMDYPIHSFLARYFGIPLVESRDLSFRSGNIYLKLLEGLRQVDVLVRFVPDSIVDPLSRVSREAMGVAGLVETMRRGNIAVCNAPGSDIFTGEGILPTLAGGLNSLQSSNMLLQYDSSTSYGDPEEFWIDGRWQQRPLRISLFSQFVEGDWKMLRGGIASSNSQPGNQAAESISQKDIWVMSRSNVEVTTLLPALEKPSEIRRTADIPSRVADDLLWLGRHSERIWLDIQYLEKWQGISSESTSREQSAIASSKDQEVFRDIIVALLLAPENFPDDPDYSRWSLFDSVENFNATGSRVVDRFSMDAQRIIGRFGDNFRSEQTSRPRETLDEIHLLINAFNGIVMESMTRTTGWRFLEIGRRLERSLLLCESLKHLFSYVADNPKLLTLILEIFDSLMTYRFRYQLQPQIEGVVDLLILDETNPRSLAYQLDALHGQISVLPGIRDGAYRSRPERIIIELQSMLRMREGSSIPLRDTFDEDAQGDYLQDFLETLHAKLNDLASAISDRYLTKTESSQFVRAMDKAE